MLSRDRQMEINKSTLQLLLRLLDPFDKDDPAAQKQGNLDDTKFCDCVALFRKKNLETEAISTITVTVEE